MYVPHVHNIWIVVVHVSLVPTGDLPLIMVVGRHVQFLSLSKDYALPKCLQGTKKDVSTVPKKYGIPALFISDKGKLPLFKAGFIFMSFSHLTKLNG